MLQRLAELLSFDIDETNLPIRTEQIRARIKSFPLMAAGQVLIALLLVSVMWHKVPHTVLFTWLGVLYAELAGEIYYHSRYEAEIGSMDECRAWGKHLIIVVILAGSIWGVGGVLMFVKDDLAYQALLVCVFLGVAAGAATTNPVFPPSLYIYISLLILPLLVVNALVGDRTHYILAAMLVVYLAFVLNAGRELARTFELSLRRAFENVQLVNQLTEEKLHAERANQMKSRFLATASHDLRQPLHALALFVDVLKNHVHDAQGIELHGKVEQSVDVLSEMFDALLDVSRLDAGAIQPNWQLFSMQSMLNRLYDEFIVLAHAKGVQLKMSCCEEQVYSDPMLLERVLRNLISNALHHTENGAVSVIGKPVDAGLELTIHDTGIGIEPEYLPHIFEEYYQVNNPHRDRRNGLGLGLAIVKKLDQLLCLQLRVSSTPGEGSSFVMLIAEASSDKRAVNRSI